MMTLATIPLKLATAEPEFARDVTSKIGRLIGSPNEILLIGGSAGLADALHARGWQVAWATDDSEAATAAVGERFDLAALDNLDWVARVGSRRFAAIVAVGLFEFARDPAALLRALGAILSSQGRFVALIPNVAHGSMRLALLGGHFPYAAWDQPERLPFRFYTREAIETLFASAGFEISGLDRRNESIDAPSGEGSLAAISAELVGSLAEDPDALTSHFVVLARPKIEEPEASGGSEAQSHEWIQTELASRVERQAEQVAELSTRLQHLEAGLEARLLEAARPSPDTANASVLASLQATTSALAQLAVDQAHWWRSRRIADPRQVMLYHRLLHRVRGIVRAVAPPDAVILVVSRGDDALLELDGRIGWHFPMDHDGTYAGHHPADSAEAIRHLEELRARGAGFLLIPETASWWLDYYGELTQHLDRRYRVVARCDGAGVIFGLQEG